MRVRLVMGLVVVGNKLIVIIRLDLGSKVNPLRRIMGEMRSKVTTGRFGALCWGQTEER